MLASNREAGVGVAKVVVITQIFHPELLSGVVEGPTGPEVAIILFI
jgi:hypothetical protein